MIHFALLVPFMALLAPTSAHAYIDPATGGFILQVVVGAAVGSLVAVKMYWVRLKTFISKKRNR